MSKIVVNTRCLLNPLTGIQRYTSCILNYMSSNLSFEQIVPKKNFSSGLLGHLWEQSVLPVKAKNALLFSPSNSGPVFYKNQVITIHDVIPLEHPEWYNKNFSKLYQLLIPRLARTVKHIITVSQYSAERIVKVLGISKEKITVIPLGVDDSFFKSTNSELDLDVLTKFNLTSKKYILSTCAISERKNITRLLQSWEKVLPFLPQEIKLVLVGDESKVSSSFNYGKVPDRVYFLGRVKDRYLPTIYSNSLMFIFISLHEGFGLPILEAMTCGSPVITSNITSMPEVSGDAALLIDPYDLNNIADAIIKMASNEKLRKDFVVKGLERATKFTWEKTAKMTAQVLENNL